MTKYDESYLDDYEYDRGVILKSYFVVIMPKYAIFKVCQIRLTKIRRIWKYKYALPKYALPKVKYAHACLYVYEGNV